MTGTWSIELTGERGDTESRRIGNHLHVGFAIEVVALFNSIDFLCKSRLTWLPSMPPSRRIMSAEELTIESLFSYGTLRQEEVQLATFGRRLASRPDALVGYALKIVQIRDRSFVAKNGAHHRTLQFTGSASDVVEGVALALTRQELMQADDYEPDDYERVRVQLRSGLDAWVYLQTGQ
jgi:hypothetical protein